MHNNFTSFSQLDLLAPSDSVNTTRFMWVTRIVGALIVMNVIDGLFTLFWVHSDIAQEANPLMALLISIHPVLFITLKMALVHLGCILLIRYYYKMLSLVSLAIAFSVYWMLLMYHGAAVWFDGV